MNNCKTCKHWGLNRNFPDVDQRLKSCSAPAIKYGNETDQTTVPDNGALVEEDEGWGMVTGPEFGCVLHEDK